MKTDAGWKLWIRKPSAAPAVIAARRAGVVAAEVEGDDRERDRADRADAGGQAVDAVGEVDDVHHRDEAERRSAAPPASPKLDRADERQRDVRDLDARGDRDRRRDDLAGELDAPACRSKRSSSAPTSAMTTAPARMPCIRSPTWRRRGSGTAAEPTSTAAKIASPPSSGVRASPARARAGWSTAPTRRASRAVERRQQRRDGEGDEEGVGPRRASVIDRGAYGPRRRRRRSRPPRPARQVLVQRVALGDRRHALGQLGLARPRSPASAPWR